ncbi:hypothetical protein CLF_103909 [Clonorchis sinensis]|uniref:Uncharacterized protein n=1 Tax=Clonorchis sinensis TaxID=79923 RepID=G7YAL7_CLOSI|nr:hypothetical protein CLF_103909 [Clonorchis sinensis]
MTDYLYLTVATWLQVRSLLVQLLHEWLQISDSQTKKQGTAGSRINKGHKPEPREVNDKGHPSIDQNTRAREARPTTHVVIDKSGHGITEQPMETTDRTTNLDRSEVEDRPEAIDRKHIRISRGPPYCPCYAVYVPSVTRTTFHSVDNVIGFLLHSKAKPVAMKNYPTVHSARRETLE